MRAPNLVLCLAALSCASACGQSPPPDAVEVQQNAALATENVIDDARERAQMLAQHAANLEAQAARASGARREELLNQANAAMSSALEVQRSAGADAGRPQ